MKGKVLHIPEFLTQDDFDDVVELIKNFTVEPDFPGWKLSAISTLETSEKAFWCISLDNYEYFSKILFQKVKKTLLDITGESVELLRVYINGTTFGQQGYYHPDSYDEDDRTLLIYCNPEWKEEWAGATVFNQNDNITTIYPKPLSAVYFDALIPHFAQSITRDFFGLRVTLAYKLTLKK